MKNAKELIDILKDVSEDRFDQDLYGAFANPMGCGCAMHHFEVSKFGRNVRSNEFDHNKYFGLDSSEWFYIFGACETINEVAKIMSWPTCEEFTVQTAIERIKFIDKLHKL